MDTAVHHHTAWREIARSLGFDLSAEDGERLKGVGRLDALRIVLDVGGVVVPEAEALALAEQKNTRYLQLIDALRPDDVLPGARKFLERLRDRGVPTALGSASRNARRILDLLDLTHLFDVVVDGTVVSEAKPDPRVFLVAAERLGVPPPACAVYEDARAGIQAARAAGMTVIGIGDPAVLAEADCTLPGLHAADANRFRSALAT